MNFYAFHIGDYASATRHLSWDEDCAFRRLLDVYYTTERALPEDERQLFRLVCAQSDVQRDAVRVVVAEFFERTPEGWRNARADEEIAGASVARERARANANARWAKVRGNAPDDATALQRQCNGNAVASENDANPMLPLPLPLPLPNKEKKTREPRFDAVASLKYFGVGETLAGEWLAFRRAKRAPVSQTVIDVFHAEAGRARLTMAEVLSVSISRGWTGFKAEWVAKDPPRFASREDVARMTVPGSDEEDPALRKMREDDAKTAPMPAAIRDKLAPLLKRKA